MDSLITAAALALARGDPLGALKRVALREDAPALALRGIAMAQLGDYARAKTLLRRAARTFGPHEAMARARCVVAEAEVALRLARPRRLDDGTRRRAGNAGCPRRPRERRIRAVSEGPAPVADRTPRRCRAHAGRHRPGLFAARVAGILRTGRRRHRDTSAARSHGARRTDPGRAGSTSGRHSVADRGSPKRASRAGPARRTLDRARRRTGSSARRGRGAAGFHRARRGRMPLRRARYACGGPAGAATGVVRARAGAGRSLAGRCAAGHTHCAGVPHQARGRVASRAPAGRDRAAAHAARGGGRHRRHAARLRAGTAPRRRRRGAGTACRRRACRRARPARRRRIVVELGAGAGTGAPVSAACSGHSMRWPPQARWTGSAAAGHVDG